MNALPLGSAGRIPHPPTNPTPRRTLVTMRRRPALLLAALALAAVLAVGFSQLGDAGGSSSSTAPSAAELRERLAGAPAPLARLHARGNRLLPARSAKAELAAVKGFPVVVNKWASWCEPCRGEFPTFQQVSAELGKEVAFFGLNAQDAREDAGRFLEGYPLSFPSLYDPDLKAAQVFGAASTYFPTTVFYDASGKQTYIHQGPYYEAEELRADIAKYARG